MWVHCGTRTWVLDSATPTERLEGFGRFYRSHHLRPSRSRLGWTRLAAQFTHVSVKFQAFVNTTTVIGETLNLGTFATSYILTLKYIRDVPERLSLPNQLIMGRGPHQQVLSGFLIKIGIFIHHE